MMRTFSVPSASSPPELPTAYCLLPTLTLLLLLLLASCGDILQEDVLVGMLAGHVGAQGGPVNLSGANVYVVDGKVADPKRVERWADRTDAFGKFSIPKIHQGWITIRVEAIGFETLLRPVQVKRDSIKFVDFTLSYKGRRPLEMPILFERDYDIWLTDEYGIRQVNLTRELDPGFNKQYPGWSHDHQTMSFFRWQRGQVLAPPAIWQCRYDGADCHEVASLPQAIHSLRREPNDAHLYLFSMASPDGNSASQIFLLDAATRKVQNLSGVLAVSLEESPGWSPDGQRIAYTSYVNERPQVFSYVLRGGVRRQLTGEVPGTSARPAGNQGENRDPAWSPDGSRIAFVSNRSGQSQVWVMYTDGTGAVQVTNLPHGSCSLPVWSPDGSKLLFNSTYLQKNPGRSSAELWVVGVDGSGLRMVTNDAVHAAW